MPVTDQEKAAKARDAALQGALTQIEREFGKGTVMRMGDEGAQVRCEAIPTGALSLDLALGIGGVPRGRIVEVFGPESSGKTTLVYHVLAEAQKLGGVCAFIDAEHAMDPLYAKEIGVDIDELLVSQPDYGEQALEIADMLVRSGAVDVVAIDSVAAPFRQAEFDIEFGKGVSTSGCLLDLGLEHNIVSKSGSFFSYGNDRLGQGRPNAKAHLDANPALAKEIEEKIYAALGLSKDAVTPIDRDGEARPPIASEPAAPAAARAA